MKFRPTSDTLKEILGFAVGRQGDWEGQGVYR